MRNVSKVPVIISDQIDMVDEIKKNNSAIICKCNVNSLYKSIEIVLKIKRKKTNYQNALNL